MGMAKQHHSTQGRNSDGTEKALVTTLNTAGRYSNIYTKINEHCE